MTHGFMSILKEDVSVLISMDEVEIGLFFLRLFIVRENRLLLVLKLLLFRRAEFFNEVDAYVRIRVRVRVLRRSYCCFRLLMFLGPLFEFGLFLVKDSKILVKDLTFRGSLAEEVYLMLKPFAGECLLASLGLCR